MNLYKNKNSHDIIAIVRASTKITKKYNTKKLNKYKHKFNALLPSPLDYYSGRLPRFRRGSKQGYSLCPFHNERNPSFTFNLESGAFICFSCGVSGGDIIAFHMKRYNLNFLDACLDLGVLL